VSDSDPQSLGAFSGTRNAYQASACLCGVAVQLTAYVGYVAGVLTVVSLIPQVLRTWRTKQTKDLSVRTFLLLITSGILWITYGALASDWPVIATNAGMVVLNGAILGAKMRYQ
jgi:MtN3 and saliva related transmembrane protein